MKQRMRKIDFSLSFFEHQYLTYYSRLNCVSDFSVGLSFHFIKSRKIIWKNNIKVSLFCHKIRTRP